MSISTLPLIFKEVLSNPLFWNALRRAEAEYREIRFIVATSMDEHVFSISYANAVPFMDWFGKVFDYAESSQVVLRRDLLNKLSLSIPRGNIIEVELRDRKYGPIMVRFSCVDSDEGTYFRIEMCNVRVAP